MFKNQNMIFYRISNPHYYIRSFDLQLYYKLLYTMENRRHIIFNMLRREWIPFVTYYCGMLIY